MNPGFFLRQNDGDTQAPACPGMTETTEIIFTTMPSLNDWCQEYDARQNSPEYKQLACIEGHITSLDEMKRLNTHGFCPKCSQPITSEADEACTRMLEEFAEQAMLARDYFIQTGRIPSRVEIPIGKKRIQVITVLGQPYATFLSERE